MQPDCSCRWLATFVTKRHYAYSAMEVKQGADGVMYAIDPRFNHWQRLLIRAAYNDPETGKRQSCWDDMWPVDRAAKKLDPSRANRVSLEEIEERIGPRRFLAEYMAKPGEADDAYFRPELKEHGYWFEEVDQALETNPRQSTASICWSHKKHGPKRMLVREFLNTAKLAITADTSFTASTTSDYKACILLALTPDNELFALDLWAMKTHEDTFISAIFKMTEKWGCPVVCPEVVKQGLTLYQSLLNICATKAAAENFGVTRPPAIMPIKPGNVEKQVRIAAGLAWRFENSLIKLPFHLKGNRPWNMLFDQIEGFNPDAADGGLQNDDCIDCLAMSQYAFKARPPRAMSLEEDVTDPLEQMKEGRIHTKSGMPIAHGIDWSKVSVADMMEIVVKTAEPKRGRTLV
jgi:hypothetical protein